MKTRKYTMALDVAQLMKMSQAQLDELFRNSPAGDIPRGEGEGTVIIGPGTELTDIAAKFAHLFAWQGKVFDPETGQLCNKILPPGIRAIVANVYKTKSDNVACNGVIPFGKFSNIHFARLFVLDESIDLNGRTIPPSLVFMSECDASLDRLLNELVDIAGEGLDKIYSHCVDYHSLSEITRKRRLAYLRSKMVNASAYYVNTVGRTVEQIRQESQLRNAIQDFLDHSQQDWSGRSPLEVRAKIQAYIRSERTLNWARKPPAQPGLFFKLKETLHLVGIPLLVLVLLPVLIPVLPIWLLLLRIHELSDAAPHFKPDDAHIQDLAALEDHVAQNQFTAVGYVKPGWFRRLTVWGILLAANYGTRHIFNKENLAGVKTIHFARWVVINEQRRVIFASNYDGSLESYMDDFIDKVAWGLNAFLSNGVGFPKTTWLVFDGAKHEQC